MMAANRTQPVGDEILTSDGENEPIQESSITKKGKFRSAVWDYFDRIEIGGMRKAQCKHCKAKLVARATDGTRHLHDHLRSCSMRNQLQITDYNKKLKMVRDEEGNVKVETFKFDPEVTKEKLAKMIIVHEYPFSCVEHRYLREMMNSLNPSWNTVSRNTIKTEVMHLYELERAKVISCMERAKSRIAITTDLWTSSQVMGYMAITGHWIDDSWDLQSKILRFMHVRAPHTGDELCKALFKALVNLNIDRKVSAITVDNCSTNDRMIQLLLQKLDRSDLIMDGQLFQVRCTAHILNLVVKDGLSVIGGIIDQIRESVTFWTLTPKRREKFYETARRLNCSCTRQLVLDCVTRWNSTYLMLSSALEYRNVFSRLTLIEMHYRSLPSEQEWELAEILANNLKPFYDVTEVFSRTRYPTSNLFFIHICEIRLSLDDWLESTYEEVRSMANYMLLKFDKYWKETHGILALASMLDPRFKMKLMEYYFPLIYGVNSVTHCNRIIQLCCDLVKSYEAKLNSQRGSSASSSNENSTASNSRPFMPSNEKQAARRLGFINFVEATANQSNKTEFQIYLEEPNLPNDASLDILGWWKANRHKYPLLSTIARDILAIPVSTVASESAFSIAGRVVSPHRSRLHPLTVEALMCTQSWLREDGKPILSSIEDSTVTLIQGDVEDFNFQEVDDEN